jgi:hypothetical protein
MNEVPLEDLWVMLLSTIRYSMGRATYMPTLCAEMYARYRGCLSRDMRLQVMREIEEELEMRTRVGKTLGWPEDHKVWSDLAARIRSEEIP